jgi:hypothetical protein
MDPYTTWTMATRHPDELQPYPAARSRRPRWGRCPSRRLGTSLHRPADQAQRLHRRLDTVC